MLEIVPFTLEHLAAATLLAQANYAEACRRLPALPATATLPDLTYFAENGMGSALVEGGRLLGFLGGVSPFEGLFGPVLGTLSPLHAHATTPERRGYLYSLLYQAAAEQWVAQGVTSHAIVLYAGETESVDAFFMNGFGMRTIDAVRPMKRLTLRVDAPPTIRLAELPPQRFAEILPLHHGLATHLRASPLFMPVDLYKADQLSETFAQRASRIFAALAEDEIIGYMELSGEGENFITTVAGMPNICGAFLQPAYRGRGIYDALLDFMIATLQGEGYTHLGVDFEGFNPAARGFWLRHFSACTYGVTRRIDERILG